MKLIALFAALTLVGCTTAPPQGAPQQHFFDDLRRLCGQAFEGRVTSPPVEADAAMASQRLVMHVRECSSETIRIPFHVGEDRSRTWIVTRTPAGLRLKHDHRHEDGSEDRLTQYGGDARGPGTARRVEFPADQFSKDLFVREGLPQSVPNVWAMELQRGRYFAYELRRPGRFFRVEFDLARPVAAPPPPWGAR
jgi:hypothetical protein